jgi:glycoprotein endo-alpha-1,2-mannosidase
MFQKIIILFVILTIKITFSATSDKQVHAFYYLWYGTPEIDGSYKHWDHEVLPHWEERINLRYSNIGKRHLPPQDIHSPYYPLRNAYSSKDPKILKDHFADMKVAGINVAVLSWWGQQSKSYATDTQGISTDLIMEEILTFADKDPSGIKIALHLEPYPSRSVDSVKEDIEYILSRYGHHVCLYRNKANLPLFYVYDSYHLFPSQWSRLLSYDGDISIRGTEFDAEFIGLWLNSYHGRDLKEGGFDGIYTYFASDSFSYGSNINNFRDICKYSNKQKMSCILSVGPGYNDTSIRPWNGHNTKDRK